MKISRTVQNLIILGLTLLAFLLRAYRLDVQSFWIDEAWTIHYANMTPPQLLHALQTSRLVPPLYHFLTLYWSRLMGDGEFSLRFLSLVFGVLTVPLTFRLGKAMGDSRLGIVAALFMAVAPYQIWHSQDARNYTMLTAAGAMSMWGFVNMWQRGGRRWQVVYIVGTAIALMTHFHGLMLVGIQGLFLLLTWRRHWRDYLKWVGSLAIVLLLFIPWLIFSFRLLQSFDNWIPQPGLWESYLRGAIAYSVGELVPRAQAIPMTVIFLAMFVGGLVYAARRNWGKWRGREMLAFLLAFTLAPNVAAWLYGLIKTSLYLERYLIVVQLGYVLVISMAVLAVADGLRKRLGWGSTIVALIPVLLLVGMDGWVLKHHYFDPAYAKPDWRAVADTIEDFGLPGDAIVITGDGGEKLFDYYYQGDLPIYLDFLTPAPTDEEARQIMAEIAADHDRIWFSPYGVGIDATLEAWLAENAYPAWQNWIGRKRLALYAGTTGADDRQEGLAFFFAEDGAQEVTGGEEGSLHVEGAGLALLGLRLPDEPVAAGAVLPLTMEWQATAPLENDYGLSLRLINQRGDVFAQSDWPPLGFGGGTTSWEPGLLMLDRRGLWLPPDVPPGDYAVQVVVYNPIGGQELGQPVVVAELELTPSDLVPPVEALALPNPSQQSLGDLVLVGYVVPDSVQPGDDLWLWLHWQLSPELTIPLAEDSALRVTLIGDEQTTSRVFSLAESVGSLDSWQPGQVRRAVYYVPIASRLAGDQVQVEVNFISGGDESTQLVSLPPVGLRQRPRQYEVPPIPQPVDYGLGDPPEIKLIGYGIPAGHGTPGKEFPVTLYWQSEIETDADYTVFVQMLTGDWQVVAQYDSQPLEGEARTSSWLAGEIVTDPYHLILPVDLPDGEYRVIAGMYDAATGQRLPVSTAEGEPAGDFVELGTVSVP